MKFAVIFILLAISSPALAQFRCADLFAKVKSYENEQTALAAQPAVLQAKVDSFDSMWVKMANFAQPVISKVFGSESGPSRQDLVDLISYGIPSQIKQSQDKQKMRDALAENLKQDEITPGKYNAARWLHDRRQSLFYELELERPQPLAYNTIREMYLLIEKDAKILAEADKNSPAYEEVYGRFVRDQLAEQIRDAKSFALKYWFQRDSFFDASQVPDSLIYQMLQIASTVPQVSAIDSGFPYKYVLATLGIFTRVEARASDVLALRIAVDRRRAIETVQTTVDELKQQLLFNLSDFDLRESLEDLTTATVAADMQLQHSLTKIDMLMNMADLATNLKSYRSEKGFSLNSAAYLTLLNYGLSYPNLSYRLIAQDYSVVRFILNGYSPEQTGVGTDLSAAILTQVYLNGTSKMSRIVHQFDVAREVFKNRGLRDEDYARVVELSQRLNIDINTLEDLFAQVDFLSGGSIPFTQAKVVIMRSYSAAKDDSNGPKIDEDALKFLSTHPLKSSPEIIDTLVDSGSSEGQGTPP